MLADGLGMMLQDWDVDKQFNYKKMKIYAVVIGDKNMWYFHSVLFTIESEAKKEAAEIAKRWTMENDDEEYTLHADGVWRSKTDYIAVREYELR